MSGRSSRKAADAEGGINYSAAGVNYTELDAGKRLALAKAMESSPLLTLRGGRAVDQSRGEPAFVFQFGDQSFAFVLEGLGTKSIIAKAVLNDLGLNRYDAVAYDAVAAIVNDLCCVGARPLVVNAYFATGASDWYAKEEPQRSIVEGWARACQDAGVTWGGGESPSLPELVTAGDIELAGSAIGVIPEGREPLLGDRLAPGDEIVIVASSGIHANGASLARMVADKIVPEHYKALLPSGRMLGEALLDPSIMYAPLVDRLLDSDLSVHYLSHITGHGLLKLMRPARDLTYRITELPPVPEVLTYLVHETEMSPDNAYSTFNMGCGFAVYCARGAGEDIVSIASDLELDAVVAGVVEAGRRQVILEPRGITYTGDELRLAPEES